MSKQGRHSFPYSRTKPNPTVFCPADWHGSVKYLYHVCRCYTMSLARCRRVTAFHPFARCRCTRAAFATDCSCTYATPCERLARGTFITFARPDFARAHDVIRHKHVPSRSRSICAPCVVHATAAVSGVSISLGVVVSKLLASSECVPCPL